MIRRGSHVYKSLMKRNAEDDFYALLMCDAMERAGATVVAITPNGTDKYSGAIDPHVRFIVWARVRDDAHIKAVDREIDSEFEKRQ